MSLALLDLNGDEVVHRQQQFRIFKRQGKSNGKSLQRAIPIQLQSY